MNARRTPLLPGLADPLVSFLSRITILLVLWYLFRAFVLQPWGVPDAWLVNGLTDHAGALLRALGYELLPVPFNDGNRYIGIQGGHHLWVGDACNGLSVMAVFAIFICAYPGTWRGRAWMLPFGILTIHLLNVVRVAALCLVAARNYEWLTFNHDYTFYVVVYGWVLLLWWWWVRADARAHGKA